MEKSIIDAIRSYGVVPVLVIENLKDALPLAEALYKGRLPVAEVTFRTACAKQAIQQIANVYPEMLIGAGTVINIDQVKEALDAGAKYIVSPSFNPKVVSYCVKNDVLIFPNCTNNYEIEQALEMGIKCIKFFPAGSLGGVSHLKSINSIYGNQLTFMPTGGINENNIKDYVEYKNVLAVGGSWIAKSNMIKEGRFDEITKKARAAVMAAVGFSFSHVGIDSFNDKAIQEVLEFFQNIFDLPIQSSGNVIYAGSNIEILKSQGRGNKGHIGFKTVNIDRAIAFFTRENIAIDFDSVRKNNRGEIELFYLEKDILGFSIHICV